MKAVGPSRSKIAVFAPFIFRGVGYFSLDAGYSPFPPLFPTAHGMQSRVCTSSPLFLSRVRSLNWNIVTCNALFVCAKIAVLLIPDAHWLKRDITPTARKSLQVWCKRGLEGTLLGRASAGTR
jgi:hypothetical protein